MKKLAIGIGMLLLLAVVLPVAAAPVRLSMTTGVGYIICPNSQGEKCRMSWTARTDKFGNVNGQAKLTAGFPDITLHAKIDQLDVINGSIAYVGGVITYSPDDPDWLNQHICFKVKDGGEGGDDYISGWYKGDANFCKGPTFPPFYLFNGNVKVA